MFATVMCLVLPMCILISCSSLVCVLMALGMFLFVKVMSSLISVMSPPPWVCSVCAYGGVVGYFRCFRFLCEFCFLDCDDVWLGAVYEVFKFLDFVSDAVYVDLKYDDVFVLWLIVVCEWLGGDLSVSGWVVICL